MKTIAQIYAELYDADQIENYAEYDLEQLMESFNLNHDEANKLYLVLQGATNIDYNMPGEANHGAFMTMLDEAAHQNYDGWNENDKMVIQAFLADIAHAVKEEMKGN